MPNTPRYLEQGPEARPRNLLADYARDYGLHGLSNRLNDPTSGIGLITDAVGSVAMPAYNALMSPYRALTGEMGDYETNKDAYIQAGMDVAGTAMTGGLAAPRPQNSLGALSSRIQKQIPNALAAERSLDALGYYSQALEAARSLKQAKGTPEQMLAQLKSAGVKDAEIEATGLRGFLDGKRSVARDEIAGHLEANRVGLREVIRSDEANANGLLNLFAGRANDVNAAPPKWQDYSLDPSNPTYRETVLHLPTEGFVPGESAAHDMLRQRMGSRPAGAEAFRSGHFPEPNIVGHMMTSMTKHEGRPVYTIDQIQSDWGQKLRDGGVRDEAKIAELERLYREANAKALAMEVERLPTLTTRGAEDLAKQKFGNDAQWATLSDEQRQEVAKLSAENAAKNIELNRRMDAAGAESDRLEAEWNTARNSAFGHPLVNTTDQWVNTTLRRALRQAADSEADYVAIPSGKTVLSYNPGDERGMQAFYDQIVPKNLGNILGKYGKPQRQYVETLDTPSRGAAGQGFSLFQLTPDARDQIKQGMPLFANGRPGAATGAAVNANNNDDGLNAILNKYGLSDLLRPSGDWTTKVRPGDA